MKEKTYVEDIDRSMYEIHSDSKDYFRIEGGLNEDVIRQISKEKNDPEWMLDFRLH